MIDARKRDVQVILVALLAGILALALFADDSGCTRENRSTQSERSATIELTYWPAPNPQEVQLADSLVRTWNRLHPEIHVKMQPIPVSQSTEEVLLAAIAGRTTPDVCSNIQPAAVYDYSRAGGILPLDRFRDFDSTCAARTPADLLQQFQASDGHYYQIPWKTNPVMLFYNVDMFQGAGITVPPRTYSEFLADARKLTRDLDGDGQIDVWAGERDIRPIWWERLFDFYPFFIGATSGNTLLNKGKPDLDNEAAAEVFAFFQTCYRENFFPHTFFQGGDPFLLEKKATHFAGPWEIATLRTLAPKLRYGVAPLPVPDNHTGPVFTYGDYKNIAIFGTTKHPQEAWEFVQYLLRAQNDLLLLELTNQIPIRGDLLTNPVFADYFRRNPNMVIFSQQAVYTRSIDSGPDMKEILDVLSQEYESCAVYGKKTPRQAAREATERAQSIIDWNE